MPPEAPEDPPIDDELPPIEPAVAEALKQTAEKKTNGTAPRRPRAPAVADDPFEEEWPDRDAHYQYGHIVDRCARANNVEKTPANVMAYIDRVEPAPPMTLPPFNCDGINSADEFWFYVANYYHARFRGPAVYSIRFQWRRSTMKIITRGTIRFPSPEEIAQLGAPRQVGGAGVMNQAPYQAPQLPAQQQQPAAPRFGFPAPPAPPQQQPQAQQAAPQGVGAPQQQQQPYAGVPAPQNEMERIALDYFKRLLDAQGQPPPPPPPQSAQFNPEAFAEALLRKLGIGVGGALPNTAQPVSAPTAFDAIKTMRAGLRELRSVKDDLDNFFEEERPKRVVVEDTQEPVVEATAHVVPPGTGPSPTDETFYTWEIPGSKIYGQPAKMAVNKTTKTWDLMGLIMSNGGMAEKVTDAITGTIEKLGSAAEKAMRASLGDALGAEVVEETPAGAVDAGETGPDT